MTSPLHSRLASFWRVAAIVLSLSVVLFASTQPQVSNDFWLQCKIGEIILHAHSIPATLQFPFTEASAQHFNAHEWLPSVLFYYLVQLVGEEGLPFILGLSGAALFAVVSSMAAKRAQGNLALGLLCGMLALLLENYRHFLRPELLSLFFFVAFWHCLETARLRWTWLGAACTLLIQVLWANTHGSFVLGPVLAALYALGTAIDAWRRPSGQGASLYFWWLAVLCLLGTLVNPFGVELLEFVVNFGGGSASKREIVEWSSSLDPRLQHTLEFWLATATAAGLVLLALLRVRSLSAVDLLILLFFLLLGLYAYRFLLYIGLVAALLIPKFLPARGTRHALQTLLFIVLTACSVLLMLLASRLGNMNGNFPYKSDAPEVLTQGMKATLASPQWSGNVYNSYDLGAELVYRSYPRLRPSIDSRIDSYGDAYFQAHEQMLRDPSKLAQFVTRYKVRYMLLTLGDMQICQQHGCWGSSVWLVQAQDQRAAFLVLQ
jgi:hypothetical protein